ncbi:MAG: retron system putative HNH endonuclease [Byssovorax sp.]
MKHIHKLQEPPGLATWRRENITNPAEPPDWDDFEAGIRRVVKDALFAEQGHLCCYCGRGIVDGDSHIEHLAPRETHRPRTYDFDNLLACCQQNLLKKDPRHCGVKKDKWYDATLLVSPLDPACEVRFRYEIDGHIHPASVPDLGAEETIVRLALDCAKLVNLRNGAIDGLLEGLDEEALTPEEGEALVRDYESRDAEGKFKPFSFVLAAVVRAYVVG